MGKIEDKLAKLGHALPAPSPPGKLEACVRVGNLVYTSGVGSTTIGKLGRDLDAEKGYKAAQDCCLKLLANLKSEIGDLDKIRKIVKLLSMVNSTLDFIDQPAVAHGCTDLLIELFGEQAGKHCRSAVGMASLPGGCAVEIEMIAEVTA